MASVADDWVGVVLNKGKAHNHTNSTQTDPLKRTKTTVIQWFYVQTDLRTDTARFWVACLPTKFTMDLIAPLLGSGPEDGKTCKTRGESVHPSFHPSVHLSVRIPVFMSIHICVHLSPHQSACPSVNLPHPSRAPSPWAYSYSHSSINF